MSESFFIESDTILTDTVPARPGLYPEFAFTYKPALPEKVAKFLRGVKETPKEDFRLETDLLEKHLVSWTITLKGEPVQITASLLNRLHPSARAHLVNAISGFTAPGVGNG